MSDEDTDVGHDQQNSATMDAPETDAPYPSRATPIIFGASVIGPYHVLRGIPCQDACAYQTIEPACAAIAVADGLGSASKSDIGANVAVTAAIEFLAHRLEVENSDLNLIEFSQTAIQEARKALEEMAVELQCALSDLACTMIVIMMNENYVAVSHIGDGAVVAEMDGNLQLVSAPGESEYTNEVVPLTSPDWENHVRTGAASGVTAVAAFTDGCQRAALAKSENGLAPFAKFFDPIFSFAREVESVHEAEEEIAALLSSKKLCENSEDDKTLVVALLQN